MHKIEDLKIWQKSIELHKRSSISIASNIAEGAGRNSNKEFYHFLGIANGSA